REKMKLMNVTKHPISLANEAGEIIATLPPSGIEARVAVTPGAPEAIDGIPVPVMGLPTYGEVVDLPPPEEGVLYIASLIVCQRAGRADVVQPGTGPGDHPVREGGNVVAVRRLVSHAAPAKEGLGLALSPSDREELDRAHAMEQWCWG